MVCIVKFSHSGLSEEIIKFASSDYSNNKLWRAVKRIMPISLSSNPQLGIRTHILFMIMNPTKSKTYVFVSLLLLTLLMCIENVKVTDITILGSNVIAYNNDEDHKVDPE